MNKKERVLTRRVDPTGKQLHRATEKAGKILDSVEVRATQATSLAPQETILSDEEDLPMLQLNEREYGSAVSQNMNIYNILRLIRGCGLQNEALSEIWLTIKTKTNKEIKIDKIAKEEMDRLGWALNNDSGKKRLLSVYWGVLMKSEFFKDEYDSMIRQMLNEDPSLPVIDYVSEQVRSQTDTLDLVRLQIEYLKEQRKKEKLKLRKIQLVPKQSEVEESKEALEPLAQALALQAEAQTEVQKPFGLKEWHVFWTEVRFSDNPNHLIELPTDSRNNFVDKLEEINAGRKRFPIKPTSVAACLEMWGMPEFRQRAVTSRFKYGPKDLRDWTKLPRGQARIMVKSIEGSGEIVFFAADRDTVYRGIFAGMSS